MATAEVISGPGRAGLMGGLMAPSVPLVGKLSIVVWLYILTIAFPLGFQVGSLAMSPMRVLLLAMVIPLTIGLFSGRYGRILPTDWLLFIHIAWATVAMAVNNPSQVVENIGSAAIELIGGYLVGRAYIRSPADFAALCRALFLVVLLWVPFTFYETMTGDPVLLTWIEGLPGISTYANVNKELRMGLERVQGIFAHPIHFGLFCSIVFSLAFVGFRGIYSGPKRWAVATLVGASTFLALSAGALLALILQVFLIFWHFVFRTNDRKWSILLGLFVLAYIVIDLLSNRTPIKVFMSYATFSAHTAYWRGLIFEYGMQNVWANPIFGIGLRSWVRPSFMNSGSMDNFWLVMAVRYGIPGFLTITLAYVDIVRRVGIRDFRADPIVSQFRLAWMFTFMGLSFTLSTVHIWTALFSFVFFFLGAGAWFIAHQPQAESTEKAVTAPGRAPIRYAREHVAEVQAPREGIVYARSNVLGPASGDPVADDPGQRRDPLRFSRFERSSKRPGAPVVKRTRP